MPGEEILFSRIIVINRSQLPCEIPKILVPSEARFQVIWLMEIIFLIRLTLKQSWPTLVHLWAFITCQQPNHWNPSIITDQISISTTLILERRIIILGSEIMPFRDWLSHKDIRFSRKSLADQEMVHLTAISDIKKRLYIILYPLKLLQSRVRASECQLIMQWCHQRILKKETFNLEANQTLWQVQQMLQINRCQWLVKVKVERRQWCLASETC